MLKILVSLQTLAAARPGRGDRGATAVEYGLMVSLIAVVVIAAVTLIGTNLNTLFGNVAAAL
jgi:pilus assembly protein Flp/PilA